MRVASAAGGHECASFTIASHIARGCGIDVRALLRTHLKLVPRERLADDLGLQRDALLNGQPIAVLSEACLPLFVYHQHELDSHGCSQ